MTRRVTFTLQAIVFVALLIILLRNGDDYNTGRRTTMIYQLNVKEPCGTETVFTFSNIEDMCKEMRFFAESDRMLELHIHLLTPEQFEKYEKENNAV